MISRPTKPDASRIRAALGITTFVMATTTDWLHNTMTGAPYPRSGPGCYPGPNDLDRAVTIVRDTPDTAEHDRALAALAFIAAGDPYLLTPEADLPFVMCGDGVRYRVDEISPCAGDMVAEERALIGSLSADDRRAVALMAWLTERLLTMSRDPESDPDMMAAIEVLTSDIDVEPDDMFSVVSIAFLEAARREAHAKSGDDR